MHDHAAEQSKIVSSSSSPQLSYDNACSCPTSFGTLFQDVLQDCTLIRRTTNSVVRPYKCGDLYNRAELWRQSVIKVNRDSRAHRRGAERPGAGPSLAVP